MIKTCIVSHTSQCLQAIYIYIYRAVRFVTTDGGTVLVEACQHSDNISLMRDKPECGPEQCAASAEAQPLA